MGKQTEKAQPQDSPTTGGVQDANPEAATGFQTEEQKKTQHVTTTDAQKELAVVTEQNNAQEQPSFFQYVRGYQANEAPALEGAQHNLSGIQAIVAHEEYAKAVEAEKENQAKGEGDNVRLLTSTKEK